MAKLDRSTPAPTLADRQPDLAPKKVYVVCEGHNLNHGKYKAGEEVDLSESAASPLLALGVVALKKAKPFVSAKEEAK